MNSCLALRAAATLLAAASVGPVYAADAARLPPVIGATERAASDPRSGLGLAGWDPVSYLVDGAPRAGLPAHEIVWGGLAWRFASAANRAAFARDPDAFAPRLGGFDVAGIVRGRVAPGDPAIYAIREGRLYVFRDGSERDRLRVDAAAFAEAEARWARLRASLGDG